MISEIPEVVKEGEREDIGGAGEENSKRSIPWNAAGRTAADCLAEAKDPAVLVEGSERRECFKTASTLSRVITGEYGSCAKSQQVVRT